VSEAESKGITFTYLYGGITDDVKDIPFYQKVGEWLDGMWSEFVISGNLTTPIFKRQIHFSRIESPTKQKVFNYLLQALETEINYKKLAEILAAMEGKMSKPILYTYDSLLIDTHSIEREWVLTTLRTVMERGGFPVRAYEGNNYNDLEVIA
jgi:predicted AAA+ superfamily ATPase